MKGGEKKLLIEKHPCCIIEGPSEFSPCKRFFIEKEEEGCGGKELVVGRAAAVEDWSPAHWQQWTTRTIIVGPFAVVRHRHRHCFFGSASRTPADGFLCATATIISDSDAGLPRQGELELLDSPVVRPRVHEDRVALPLHRPVLPPRPWTLAHASISHRHARPQQSILRCNLTSHRIIYDASLTTRYGPDASVHGARRHPHNTSTCPLSRCPRGHHGMAAAAGSRTARRKRSQQILW